MILLCRIDCFKIFFCDSNCKIMLCFYFIIVMVVVGVLILIVFIGIGFNWKNMVKGIVGFVMFSEVGEYELFEVVGYEGICNIDQVVKVVLEEVGGGKLLLVNVFKLNSQLVNVCI